MNENFNWSYLASYGSDTRNVILSPGEWSKTSWLKFAGVAAVTGGLFFADKGIKRVIQRNQSSFGDDFFDLFNTFGEINLMTPSILGAYLVGEFTANAKVKRVSLLLLKSLVITGVLQQGVSRLPHRHRPDESPHDSHVWDGPNIDGSNLSFPSGHSSISFSVATTLSREFSDYQYSKHVFYMMCGLTALSRVYFNRHWVSDVVMGSAFGHYVSSVVHESNSKSGVTSQKNQGLQGFVPLFKEKRLAGVSLLYSF